jgi:hypothetical protein
LRHRFDIQIRLYIGVWTFTERSELEALSYKTITMSMVLKAPMVMKLSLSKVGRRGVEGRRGKKGEEREDEERREERRGEKGLR